MMNQKIGNQFLEHFWNSTEFGNAPIIRNIWLVTRSKKAIREIKMLLAGGMTLNSFGEVTMGSLISTRLVTGFEELKVGCELLE